MLRHFKLEAINERGRHIAGGIKEHDPVARAKTGAGSGPGEHLDAGEKSPTGTEGTVCGGRAEKGRGGGRVAASSDHRHFAGVEGGGIKNCGTRPRANVAIGPAPTGQIHGTGTGVINFKKVSPGAVGIDLADQDEGLRLRNAGEKRGGEDGEKGFVHGF